MQLTYKGKKEIKGSEALRLMAYLDRKKGVWTIGWGTTRINGKPVQEGMTCTEAEAEMWLEQDTALVQTSINKYVKVPLTQNMFDALVSFVYNIGITAFSGSTMLKLLNAGMYAQAAEQFRRWRFDDGVEVQGLLNRRMREKELFLSKV